MNLFHKFSIACITMFAVLLFGCGEKKTETTDTQKKDNVTQNNQIQTNQTTEKKDTMQTTTKTDTIKSKNKEDDGSNIVILKTSMGEIQIELNAKDAPLHTANFKKLVKNKFYDGLTFHRVIKGFMVQGGDPNSKDSDRSNDGQGGPGYTIPAEIKMKHEQGSIAGARLGDQQNPKRESSGSQFYIVTGNASHLDGQYTVFGKVTKGMDVVMKIEKVKVDQMDNPVEKVTIEKATLK